MMKRKILVLGIAVLLALTAVMNAWADIIAYPLSEEIEISLKVHTWIYLLIAAVIVVTVVLALRHKKNTKDQ